MTSAKAGIDSYFKARRVCDDELASRGELREAYDYVLRLGGRDAAEEALLQDLESRLARA